MNTASRMESTSLPCRVQCSAKTAELLRQQAIAGALRPSARRFQNCVPKAPSGFIAFNSLLQKAASFQYLLVLVHLPLRLAIHTPCLGTGRADSSFLMAPWGLGTQDPSIRVEPRGGGVSLSQDTYAWVPAP